MLHRKLFNLREAAKRFLYGGDEYINGYIDELPDGHGPEELVRQEKFAQEVVGTLDTNLLLLELLDRTSTVGEEYNEVFRLFDLHKEGHTVLRHMVDNNLQFQDVLEALMHKGRFVEAICLVNAALYDGYLKEGKGLNVGEPSY